MKLEINDIRVENMIYEIRGCQVMLDSDLAKLYNVETKRINEAVKRNKEKFPKRFSFILDDDEMQCFEVANCDFKIENRGERGNNLRIFTEQGVAMLATILKSKVATEVSIRIIDAFVEMRKYLTENSYDKRILNIETRMIEYDNKFEEIFNKFGNQVDNHIFFQGQIYDVHSLLVDILKGGKAIDNYLDKNILDVISLLNIKVTVITSEYNKYDVDKYNEQYDNIEILYNKKFYDRFITLDYEALYHCGAPFKNLGKKCFSINKINNQMILQDLIKSNIYMI